MKRLLLSFATVLTVSFAAISFAATSADSSFIVSAPIKNGTKSLKSGIPYRIDFTVVNNSSSVIYTAPVGATIYPGYHTDFQSNGGDRVIPLQISDKYGVFFNGSVCRYALVSVNDGNQFGSYQINIDNSRC